MKPRRGKKDYSAFAYHCLMRATDGRRKLTTVVHGKDLAKFYDSYTTIQRVRMVAGKGSGGRITPQAAARLGAAPLVAAAAAAAAAAALAGRVEHRVPHLLKHHCPLICHSSSNVCRATWTL